jgi:hypothetical protein
MRGHRCKGNRKEGRGKTPFNFATPRRRRCRGIRVGCAAVCTAVTARTSASTRANLFEQLTDCCQRYLVSAIRAQHHQIALCPHRHSCNRSQCPFQFLSSIAAADNTSHMAMQTASPSSGCGIRRLFMWTSRTLHLDLNALDSKLKLLGGAGARARWIVTCDLYLRRRRLQHSSSASSTSSAAPAPAGASDVCRLRFGSEPVHLFVTSSEVIEAGSGMEVLFESVQLHEKRRPIVTQARRRPMLFLSLHFIHSLSLRSV